MIKNEIDGRRISTMRNEIKTLKNIHQIEKKNEKKTLRMTVIYSFF